jgi:glutathione S-transferase
MLFESQAIIRHLDRRLPGPPLTPSSPLALARMDQWLSANQSYVAPNTRLLAIERIVKPHAGVSPDPTTEREAERALADALAAFDRALARVPYLAGDTFTLADISLLPYLASLPMIGAGRLLDELPALTGWWGRVRQRPSWREVEASTEPARASA